MLLHFWLLLVQYRRLKRGTKAFCMYHIFACTILFSFLMFQSRFFLLSFPLCFLCVSCSFRVGLMAANALSFHKNILISSSFLKGIFGAYRIWSWQFFLTRENSFLWWEICNSFFLYRWCHFSPAVFKNFSLSLVFRS